MRQTETATSIQLTALVLLLGVASAASAQWSIDEVDGYGRVHDTSVALTPSEQLVVAWGGDAVNVAEWTGSGWSVTEAVTDSCGYENPSLAIDMAGNYYVAYADFENDELELARFDGSTWTHETVSSAGQFASVALAPSGYPAIAYHNDGPPGRVEYASWNGASWDIVTVDTRASFSVSLAYDAMGYPAIAYRAYATAGSGEVRYASWDGVSWNVTVVVPASDVFDVSLAFDSAGLPSIAFQESRVLQRAWWDGASWNIEIVDACTWCGMDNSIRFNNLDEPRISYTEGLGRDLKVAVWSGGIWQIDTVDTFDRVGWDTSLAISSTGDLFVSHYDETRRAVKLARRVSGVWQNETVEAPPSRGTATSLVFSLGGDPVISYADDLERELRLARWDGSQWQIEIVASDSIYSALAYDPGGALTIAYQRSGDLVWARWNGISWDVEVVMNLGGAEPSLAFGSDGEPAIAFEQGADLHLARRQAGVWTNELVAQTGSVSGCEPSLAFDLAGYPAISYHQSPSNDLELARWNPATATWDIQVIDPLSNSGFYSSLAFDSAGNPRIAHGSSGRVGYAAWNPATQMWDLEIVEPGLNSPRNIRLVVDGNDEALVAYNRHSDGWLQLRRRSGGAWIPEIVDPFGRPTVLGSFGKGLDLALDSQGYPAIAYHADCTSSLRFAYLTPVCGNMIVNMGEQCDDGPLNSDTQPDACRLDCSLPRCGDQVVDTGEECDDGNAIPGDGCTDCLIERCNVLSITSIGLVRAVKAPDAVSVILSHAPDASADGYNTWYVVAKEDIPLARAGSPQANGVTSCDPSASTICWHIGAISPATVGPRLFYQVRGSCLMSEAPE